MKENNNRLNKGEKIYELKPEYLDNLVMKLDKQRANNRKGFYLSLTLLLLLLVVGTVLWFPNQKTEENKQLVENNNPSITNKNEAITTIKKKENKEVSKNLIHSDKENERVYHSFSVKNKSVEQISNFPLEITQNKKITKTKTNNFSTTKFSSKEPIVDAVKLRSNKDLIMKKGERLTKELETNTEKNQLVDTTISPKNKRNLEKKELVISKEQEIEIETKKETKLIDKPSSSKKIESENGQDSKSEKKNYIDSIISDKIVDTSSDLFNGFVIKESIIVEDSSEIITEIDSSLIKKDTTKLKANWQLSLLAGANVSFSRFSNPSNQVYSSVRKEEENSLVSFSGGINVDRFIGKKIKITTGLNYISYGSKTNYSPVSSFKNSRQFNGVDSVYNPVTDSIFYNPTLIWLPYLIRMDTSVDSNYINTKLAYEDSSAYLLQGRVTFSYVEIPLTIGYYKTINKWSFGINTGISIGLLTRSSGYFIGEDLKTIEVASSQKIMWNYLIGPEINCEFIENYYLGIQSNFRMGLNNLSISEPIDRKYYNLQFNLKVGYKF